MAARLAKLCPRSVAVGLPAAASAVACSQDKMETARTESPSRTSLTRGMASTGSARGTTPRMASLLGAGAASKTAVR